MSVTVSDVLQLDILNSAKVIAGKNGLDREVLRINFTDCPINPLVDAELAYKLEMLLFIASI